MNQKECIALILAGGQGSRLAALTTEIPKPALPFGGSCRLIDFSISNCYNSGFDMVGVLTAQKPFALKKTLDPLIPPKPFHIHTLPPAIQASYNGTANALYENLDFIEQYSPEYILVLAGDHVYKMDYQPLLEYHKAKEAAATIAVMKVPWTEASRFGIMTADPDGSILEFAEKPPRPKSNLASMGIYIFSWPILKYYLQVDEANQLSSHDFGKNIIPLMLHQGEKLSAYTFHGYWKDVGTVASLYNAHMDLLSTPPNFDIFDSNWPIYSTLTDLPFPVPITHRRRKSLISEHCYISGEVEKSIISPGTFIGKNAKVRHSIIMPGAFIGHGAYVEGAIIGPGAAVENGCAVLGSAKQPIAVLGQNAAATSKVAGIPIASPWWNYELSLQ